MFARRRQPDVLARLVAEYDRYARSLAARMHRQGEPREDLDQVALESLVVALHRFDPDRSLPFPSFATPTILGALRRHYRDRGWLLRIPRVAHELTTRAAASTDRLTARHGRVPTMIEVAEDLGVDIDTLVAATDATYARNTASLDATTTDGSMLNNHVGGEDLGIREVDAHVDLVDALRSVAPRNREILRLYYFEDCTQVEIGRRLGVSQMQVSRLIGDTLRQLRTTMTAA